MLPSVPVPTDNLWKFSALFGLVLIVSSITGITYLHQSTNELIYRSVVDRARLKATAPEGALVASQIAVIDKRLEIAAADKPVLTFLLTVVFTGGIALSWWGFYSWRRIQPIHDQLLKLQLAKAEREERQALEETLKDQG